MINTVDPEQDMDVLYSELQPQLVRIIGVNLQAPECVIEDACQTAWGSLLSHRQAVAPGSELGWLSTAATREVLRLLRRDRVAASLAEVAAPVRLSDYRGGESGPRAERSRCVSGSRRSDGSRSASSAWCYCTASATSTRRLPPSPARPGEPSPVN